MIIKVLAENTAISEEFKTEHGLSLYIESCGHKMLFDVGGTNVFLKNAQKLDVNLSEIDLVVISHGHIDHGGGLKLFVKENTNAPIYLHPKALGKFFSNRPNRQEYIGLVHNHKNNERFIFTSDRFFINKGIEIFSNIPGKELVPSFNKTLMMKKDGAIIEDTFEHEQNLIITEAGKTFLFAGCAHNGIVNIIKHFKHIKKRNPDFVFGGFHLYNHSTKKSEDSVLVQQIGEKLKETNAKYYTCHCTGLKSYNQLKTVMGDQIEYLATGSVLKL